MDERAVFETNLRLGRAEYSLQRAYLRSMPHMLTLVLGNACNLACPHCYQQKNSDNLLRPAEIGRHLRREFHTLYPYLSTLRIQGGEVLAYAGFREIVDEVASSVHRPILSISTNGTLIDDAWAERMVRLPFESITVSIDGATPETYAKLRRGGQLTEVLANVARLRRWKYRLSSPFPDLDSFFVILRSNFREIPQYFELMHRSGFSSVALQTVQINNFNSTREPGLEEHETVRDPAEVAELHDLLLDALPRARRCFRGVRISGLQTLFENHGLDTSFLSEQQHGLYPSTAYLSRSRQFELCPNSWTTLFVAENGGVHLCFLAEPAGNLYEAPLVEIWNSPKAVAKRLRIIQGQYMASGCSRNWCSWREGKAASPPDTSVITEWDSTQPEPPPADLSELPAVRRMLAEKSRRFEEMEQSVRAMDEEFQRMRRSVLVRGAAHIARRWDRLRNVVSSRPQ